MIHLSEEELIALVYGESESAVINGHLARCAECSGAYDALQSDLAEMKFVDPPPRDAFYGERVWASLANSLPTYTTRKGNFFRLPPWKSLSYAAACFLFAASLFIGGRLWERKQVQHTAEIHAVQKPQPVDHTPQRVLVVVLGDHLDRSERFLVELKHADAENTEMVSPLREQAQSLLAENRICRQKAEHDDDAALANALDRLDHLLQQLANQPGGLNAATLTRLQHQMKTDGLLFEVRVLRSRLPDQQGAASGQTKGNIL